MPKPYEEMTREELTQVIRGFREQERKLADERVKAEAVYTVKCDDAAAELQLRKLTPGQIAAMERLAGKVRAEKEQEAKAPEAEPAL